MTNAERTAKWRKENPEKDAANRARESERRRQSPELTAANRARARKWAQENPERVAANFAKWVERNSGRMTENSARWRRENWERWKENQRRWRLENPDKIRKIQQQTTAKNKERYQIDPRYRKFAKAKAAVSKKVYFGRWPSAKELFCAICGNKADHYHHHFGYEQEHWYDVIPVCIGCHSRLHRNDPHPPRR